MWVLNEKRLTERAGLDAIQDRLGSRRPAAERESRADAGAKLKIIRGIARSSYGVGPAA